MMKPIFKKPFGPSERNWSSFGTTRAVTCELCGTDHPELDETGEQSHHLLDFLGRQCVEECCGRIVDMIYDEWGDEFAKAFLYEFAQNPGDKKFADLRWTLGSVLGAALAALRGQELQICQGDQELKEIVKAVCKKEDKDGG